MEAIKAPNIWYCGLVCNFALQVKRGCDEEIENRAIYRGDAGERPLSVVGSTGAGTQSGIHILGS